MSIVEAGAAPTFDLQTLTGHYALRAEASGTVVTIGGPPTEHELELSLIVDGVEHSIVLRKDDIDARETSIKATFDVPIGEDQASGKLTLGVDPTTAALLLSVAIATPDGGDHKASLGLTTNPGAAGVFVPERGELGDVGDLETRAVVIDDDVQPMALVTKTGRFSVGERAPELEIQPAMKPRCPRHSCRARRNTR
jgi:hypothetical protein